MRDDGRIAVRRGANALMTVLFLWAASVVHPAHAAPLPAHNTTLPARTTTHRQAKTLASADPVGGSRLGGAGLVVDLPRGVPGPPDLKAPCFVVADANSGDVLVAKCPHTKALPASTMKALTAVTLAPDVDEGALVTAAAEDAAQDGTKVGLVPGQKYTQRELMLGMLMVSGNDAAWALARSAGMDKTLASMNATAAKLGALDTVARNPSGLDADGQTTSAYDLALIGRAAIRQPMIAKDLLIKTATFPGVQQPGKSRARTAFQIGSHNRMLWNYPGAIGVKNGYTVAAKHTYIGAARRGNQSYLVTYVASPAGAWQDTAAMFDWAFAHGHQARAVGRLVEPGEVPPSAATGNSPSGATPSVDSPSDGSSAGTPTPADGTGAPSSATAAVTAQGQGAGQGATGALDQARDRLASLVAAHETATGVIIASVIAAAALGTSLRRRRRR